MYLSLTLKILAEAQGFVFSVVCKGQGNRGLKSLIEQILQLNSLLSCYNQNESTFLQYIVNATFYILLAGNTTSENTTSENTTSVAMATTTPTVSGKQFFV